MQEGGFIMNYVSTTQGKRVKKRKKSRLRTWVKVVIVIGVLILGKFVFGNIRFLGNTYIQGVNCSFMSAMEAESKIEEELANKKIEIQFSNGRSYSTNAGTLGVSLNSEAYQTIEGFLKEQKLFSFTNNKDYDISAFLDFNKSNTKDYLSKLTEDWSEETTLDNTYIEWNDGTQTYVFNRTPEEIRVTIDDAADYIITELMNNVTVINFSKLKEQVWEAIDEELEPQIEAINSILATTVVYKLKNGTTYTLDANVMKDWVERNDGKYEISLEKHLPDFLDSLSKKVETKSEGIKFKPTGLDFITVPTSKSSTLSLDKEKEASWLKENLPRSEKFTREPFYSSTPLEIGDTYVELDITRQTVWMYKDGECILESLCVTGNVAGGHSTPTGLYYLTYKTTDAVLRGTNNDGSKYASPVKYWMPFNGGIGFHDASWRNGKFGGNIYKTDGSHGCVNMPKNNAKILYENINSEIPIIIYKS